MTTDWDALLAARAAQRRPQVMHHQWEKIYRSFSGWFVRPICNAPLPAGPECEYVRRTCVRRSSLRSPGSSSKVAHKLSRRGVLTGEQTNESEGKITRSPDVNRVPAGLANSGGDIIYISTHNSHLADLSYWMIASGIIGGLIAAVFGVIELARYSGRHTREVHQAHLRSLKRRSSGFVHRQLVYASA